MIQFRTSRCPSGALLCLGGRLRTLGSPLFALLMQATAGAAPEGSSTGILSLIARSTAISLAVLLSLGLLSIWSWGIFLYKWWTFRRAAQTKRAVSRRLPPQQQVLRGAGGLPIARRQPARRAVSDRLRRAHRAAAPDDAGRRGARPQSARARRTSYLEEPAGGRPRAAARVGGRGEQARNATSPFSRRRRASRRSSGCSARCGAS